MRLLYSTKKLTPLFQPISSRNSIRNVTCLHAFPALTSRRLVVRSARFPVFCCETRGLDFKQVYTSTPVRINAENEGVCCCLSVNDMWNVATMTQIPCARFVKNETYPRSDHSFKRRFKIVYSTLY